MHIYIYFYYKIKNYTRFAILITVNTVCEKDPLIAHIHRLSIVGKYSQKNNVFVLKYVSVCKARLN